MKTSAPSAPGDSRSTPVAWNREIGALPTAEIAVPAVVSDSRSGSVVLPENYEVNQRIGKSDGSTGLTGDKKPTNWVD